MTRAQIAALAYALTTSALAALARARDTLRARTYPPWHAAPPAWTVHIDRGTIPRKPTTGRPPWELHHDAGIPPTGDLRLDYEPRPPLTDILRDSRVALYHRDELEALLAGAV